MKQKKGYKNLRRFRDWELWSVKRGEFKVKFKGVIYDVKREIIKDKSKKWDSELFWFKDKENNKFDVTNIIYGV